MNECPFEAVPRLWPGETETLWCLPDRTCVTVAPTSELCEIVDACLSPDDIVNKYCSIEEMKTFASNKLLILHVNIRSIQKNLKKTSPTLN